MKRAGLLLALVAVAGVIALLRGSIPEADPVIPEEEEGLYVPGAAWDPRESVALDNIRNLHALRTLLSEYQGRH